MRFFGLGWVPTYDTVVPDVALHGDEVMRGITEFTAEWRPPRILVVPRARRDDARDTLSIVLASSCVVDDAGR